MKKLILVIILIFPSLSLLADGGRFREAGVNFSNLNHFGLTYRTGNEGALWRFTTFGFNGQALNIEADMQQGNQSSFFLGAGVGREYRRPIAENLYLRYGLDATFSFSREEEDGFEEVREISRSFRPGINLVIGAAYELNERLVLGAELQPSLYYSRDVFIYGESGYKSIRHGLNYHFSSAGLLFSLAYRF